MNCREMMIIRPEHCISTCNSAWAVYRQQVISPFRKKNAQSLGVDLASPGRWIKHYGQAPFFIFYAPSLSSRFPSDRGCVDGGSLVSGHGPP
jgi:hypothetical protein